MTCRRFREAIVLKRRQDWFLLLYERGGGVLRDVNVHARFCSRSAEGHAPSAYRHYVIFRFITLGKCNSPSLQLNFHAR